MVVPKHIGIILDGNRRFAKRLMLKPWMGHEWGAKKLREFLEWCKELGVEELTAYTFSVQNFNRPKEEFDYLMKLFKTEFSRMKEKGELEKLKEQGLRVTFIGRLWMFPKEIQEIMHDLMEQTKDYCPRRVNFAMAYGGREEVIDAVKRISEAVKEGKLKPEDINEAVFSKNLYLEHEPDLIIRTGGERRTSNFLIWQSNYSEWMFIDKPWPELEKQDFLKCIEDFNQRERRFGR